MFPYNLTIPRKLETEKPLHMYIILVKSTTTPVIVSPVTPFNYLDYFFHFLVDATHVEQKAGNTPRLAGIQEGRE